LEFVTGATYGHPLGKKEREELARKSLLEMGVASLANSKLYELSGGERKLISFCAALTKDPELVLFDEIEASLDGSNCHALFSILKEVSQNKHVSFIVVGQRIGIGQNLCDRFLVLNEGRVVDFAKPSDLITSESLVINGLSELLPGNEGISL